MGSAGWECGPATARSLAVVGRVRLGEDRAAVMGVGSRSWAAVFIGAFVDVVGPCFSDLSGCCT